MYANIKRHFIKTAGTVLLLLMGLLPAHAAKLPPVEQRLPKAGTTQISYTDSIIVEVTPKTGSFTDYKVNNIITLGINPQTPEYVVWPGYNELTVKLLIQPYNAIGAPMDSMIRELTVKYDPVGNKPYIDRSMLRFSGAYKVEVIVDEIKDEWGGWQPSAPINVYLTSRIEVERYYSFNATIAPAYSALTDIDLDCNGGKDELQLSWAVYPGAEEYEVEWTFVNDYNTTVGTYLTAAQVSYNFAGNATRVTTANNFYNISLLYEHGYIVYRVRAIGRVQNNPSQKVVGVWSLPNTGIVSTSAANSRYAVAEHDIKKVWQFSSNFAEEGKKKETITYFDGSLRSRQAVSRSNTEKIAIVGETMYDHQGRKAIEVLPSPVVPSCSTAQSVIRFYGDFNQDDSGRAYSRNDFDLIPTGSVCNSQTGPMGTASGASRYYSSDNPDKSRQQAYVPDAKKFPFTQVEYTPDNTGRIRRQGGVGPDHQLGTGHETQYLYGQPNQIQLDRLFASEAGNASHYKKNATIDANGQTSVTYLDQHGRVVATALAGSAPDSLIALNTVDSAQFRIDLFAKDADGKSKINRVNITEDGLEFISQYLVIARDTHTFDYTLIMPQFTDSCLKPNICFSCIYDLQMKVKNECGLHYIDSTKQMKGQFTLDGQGKPVFNLQCPGNTTFTRSSPLILDPGNYTITKVLTVNKDARDFYVQKYLDSANNNCFKTKFWFISDALSRVDTSGCHMTCTQCMTALGDKETWVSSGRGTDLEYDMAYEACAELCPRPRSLCEAGYLQMLADVSPGGQYGQYLNPATGIIATDNFPVSVYNQYNKLPKTNPHWRSPLVAIGGTNYPYYRDADGSISRIRVYKLPSGLYSPAVPAGSVWRDNAGNYDYTYPQYLTNLKDFISAWRPSWAKSLVQYHPEYCYYEACKTYGERQQYNGSLDPKTSDGFDALLDSTETYAQALAKGLTIANLHTLDPFFYNSFYQANVSSFNLATEMNGRISSFAYGKTMQQIAAAITRCGTQYANSSFTSSCYNFGAGSDASVKNKEWRLYKAFYKSEKQKIQQRRADELALNFCKGFNGCIGNDNFNPYASGMLNTSNWSASPYFDILQPCSAPRRDLYRGKTRRFGGVNDIPVPSVNDVEYQLYLETGQCPTARDLQYLLDALAKTNKLATWFNLDSVPEFTQRLYQAVHHNTMPASHQSYSWTSTPSGTQLTVRFYNNSTATYDCNLVLEGLSTSYWYAIKGFWGLNFHSISGSGQVFKIHAWIDHDFNINTPLRDTLLTGRTNCFALNNCVDSFKRDNCKPAQLAIDYANLITALQANGEFTGTNIDLNTAKYSPFITSTLRNYVGSSNPLVWNYIPLGGEIRDPLTAKKLWLTFAEPSLPPFQWLADIKPVTNSMGFTVKAYTAPGVYTTLTGFVYDWSNASVNMGTCTYPPPRDCRTREHTNKQELEWLLNSIFNYDTVLVNLSANPYLTPSLSTYLGVGNFTLTNVVIQDSTFRANISVNCPGTYPNCMSVCQIYFKKPAGSTNSFTNLTGMSNMDVIEEERIGGRNYSFKIRAEFTTGSEDIYGYTTCIPIRDCNECDIYHSAGGGGTTFMIEGSEYVMDSSGNVQAPDNGETGETETVQMMSPPPCGAAFYDLSAAIQAYNTRNGLTEGMPGYVDLEEGWFYDDLSLCNCIPSYITYINAYNVPETGSGAVNLNAFGCDKDPCLPDSVPPQLITPIMPYRSNCAQHLKDIALGNALRAYDEYIKALTSYISAAYTKRCINAAIETYTSSYTDREYHFTLYYYDQGGNLVRTIPPAGVNEIPITDFEDDIAKQINEDRTRNERTYFTDHHLASTYQYNSLNQLVRQDVPDHDKMDIWELTLPNGLPNGLVITATQFTSASKGYLTGFIGTNGYCFTTNNGGTTWIRMNSILASDLAKVQMLDNNNGYAVGSDGVLLKTTNGGISWSTCPLATFNIITRLTDLYFTDVNNGLVVGDNGLNRIITVSGGVLSATTYDGFGIPNTLNITSVSYNSGRYFLTANENVLVYAAAGGHVYSSYDGSYWTELDLVRTVNLRKIQILSTGGAVSIGEGSVLVFQPPSSTEWYQISNNITQGFRDIYFKDGSNGVAVLDNGEIWKTFNGGFDWERMSTAGEVFLALKFYNNTNGYAVGQSGLIKRIAMGSAPFGLSGVAGPPPVSDLTTLHFIDKDSGFVAGTNGKVFFTTNASGTASWTAVTTGITSTFSKAFAINRREAMFLTTSGTLYTWSGGTFTTTLSGGTNINDFAHNTTTVLAYDESAGRLYSIGYSATGFNTIWLSTPGHAVMKINSLHIDPASGVMSSSPIYIAADNGIIFKGVPSGMGGTTWSDQTYNFHPTNLYDISNADNTEFMAVGYNGSAFRSSDGFSWFQVPSGTKKVLKTIQFLAFDQGIVGGEEGYLARLNNVGSFVQVSTGIAASINDIKLNGLQALAATDDSKMLQVSNITNATTSTLTVTPQGQWQGVSYMPAATAVAVGRQGRAIRYDGSVWRDAVDMFTTALNDIHFKNQNIGYAVGNDGTQRQTVNGGETWKVITPTYPPTSWYGIFTLNADSAVAVGNGGNISLLLPAENRVDLALSLGSGLFDITSTADGLIYVVGQGGIIYYHIPNQPYYLWNYVSSGTANNLNSIVFYRKRVGNIYQNIGYIAGDNQTILYTDDGFNWIPKPTPTIGGGYGLLDIAFYDFKKGYAVGSNGVILKTTDGGDSWNRKYSGLNNTYSSNIFLAVSYPSAYQGFVGGVSAAYKISDESDRFSTRFWYDRLGRLAVSQNTKQYLLTNGTTTASTYTYTMYDALNRVVELGQLHENSGLLFPGIFRQGMIYDSLFNVWYNTHVHTEVTHTFYDRQQTLLPTTLLVQQNLRQRTASVTYEELDDRNPTRYDHGTHYSYDIHGYVSTLIQENQKLGLIAAGERYKRIDYVYDLISGKVNETHYQSGKKDQFHHKYEYDADNRITQVWTSRDSMIWDRDAKYFYYQHGLLARAEIGQYQVQGIDRAYTFQDWIKGVNSNALDPRRDMGHDGLADPGNPNRYFARDAFSYSLGYYRNDYTPIDANAWTTGKRFEANTANSDLVNARNSLYNGNISHMVTTITQPQAYLANVPAQQIIQPQGTAYKYDQLNRLLEMQAFTNLDSNYSVNAWSTSGWYGGWYNNKFTYDANGNILTQDRNDQNGAAIDGLTYNYEPIDPSDPSKGKRSNRLYHVNDNITSTYTDDIDDQGVFNSAHSTINTANNYGYDAIGNLVRDNQDGIQAINWSISGKVKSMSRASAGLTLGFEYNAAGDRVAKAIYTGGSLRDATYYVKDADGNTLATYRLWYNSGNLHITLKEHDLYGTSRLGVRKDSVEMLNTIGPDTNYAVAFLGKKQYEGVNHLGNVLAVFSDQKIPQDENYDGYTDYYYADIVGSMDYTAFGAPMPGRTFDDSSRYRYGFNGKEKDNEIGGNGNSYDYGFRIYNARLGRFLSVDPLSKKFSWLSSYQYANNIPIQLIDLDGMEGTMPGVPSPKLSPQALKSFEKVLKESDVRAEIAHAIIRELDIPDHYKQPYNRDGKPNSYYQLTFSIIYQQITVTEEKSEIISTTKEIISTGRDLELISDPLDKTIDRNADNAANWVVTKTLLATNGKVGLGARMFYKGMSKAFSFAAKTPIGLLLDAVLGAQDLGKGSSLTEVQTKAVTEAFIKFLTPKTDIKIMEFNTNKSDNTTVVKPVQQPVIVQPAPAAAE